MNNQRNRIGGRNRLGGKKQGMERSKKILLITGIVWVIVMLDEALVAHNPIWLMAFFSVAIWGFGIAYAKPGDFSKKVYERGFWRALFNRPPKRRSRGRGGRNYRR